MGVIVEEVHRDVPQTPCDRGDGRWISVAFSSVVGRICGTAIPQPIPDQ